MYSVAAVPEYNKQKQWLDEIANISPDISQWGHTVRWQEVSHVSCF